MKPIIYLTVLLFVTFFVSCTSPAKLIYLQNQRADNEKANELLKSLPAQPIEYKLGAGDRLMLNVFSLTDEKINFLKKPELEVLVDSGGLVQMPVIGAVAVGGLSIRDAEIKLQTAASDYLKSPAINVRLINFKFTVLGEVNNQGSFIASEPNINMLEALGQAGGLTDNANRENIRIIRKENNLNKIYQLNMLEDNALVSQNYQLQPNDIVLINPMKAVRDNQERLGIISILISLITTIAFVVIQVAN